MFLKRYRKRRRLTWLIRQLDPQTQHKTIFFLVGAYQFPFTAQRALEFALFRTFAVPSISGLLVETGVFQRHGQKRYDDTALLIAEIGEYGYDSPRGAAAIRRMNALHSRYDISNDNFLYVLSSFIFEPIRWNGIISWRRAARTENLANYYFWAEVGQRMGTQNIPRTYEEFLDFNEAYEAQNFIYAESNHRVAEQSLQVILRPIPKLLRPLARRIVYGFLDAPLAKALGYPQITWVEKAFIRASMACYGVLMRALPPRLTPFHYTDHPNPSYPRGYSISELGD